MRAEEKAARTLTQVEMNAAIRETPVQLCLRAF
jgi:hypothetical protein